MSDTAPALIGPNAILQLLHVIDGVQGRERLERILRDAEIAEVPDGSAMIPEALVARLHQALRRTDPAQAPSLAAEAGRRTGAYILTHRIPTPAQVVLRCLPAPLAAPVLAKAIERHAWTFVGSGQCRVRDPWTFEIAQNPVVRGERSDQPLCVWHAAVFETLYRRLVHPACACQEVSCCAQGGDHVCRFRIQRASA